jgi:chitinase
VSALAAWAGAGIPADQLVLGVPAYGHSFRVARADAYTNGKSGALALYPAFNASAQPAGDAWDDGAGTVSGPLNGEGAGR